jgi:hypothetical protein
MIKLRTSLSPDQCKARLASATDLSGLSLSWNSTADAPPVLGDFRGASFRLHTSRYYTNSFAPFFYGKLLPSDNGTLIQGEFKMHPFARLLTLFWFSFIGIFAAGGLIVPMQDQPLTGLGRRVFFEALVGFAILGVVLVKFGQWLGRGEHKTILDFLKSSLEASPV